MATETAYKNYQYSDEVGFDKKYKLSTIVQEAHKYNSEQNKWKFNPLKEGCFGFDNIAVSLCYTLKKIKSQERLEDLSIEKIADYVHRAWCKNYIYWRDNQPWKINKCYTPASKPLGDTNRNKLCETDYCDLPEDEQQKDIIFAKFIKKKFI